MAMSFKSAHFPKDMILMGVRWYVAYPLRTRHVEELMLERGGTWTTPPSIGGSSHTARSSKRCFATVSGPCGSAGAWTKRSCA